MARNYIIYRSCCCKTLRVVKHQHMKINNDITIIIIILIIMMIIIIIMIIMIIKCKGFYIAW